jgi:periplasmic protein TonB
MPRRALMLKEGRAPVWDRLLTMLFLAACLHGLIIIGLTFNAAAEEGGEAPGLEVLLVSDEVPESDSNTTAAYLAQRTQKGSGNTRESVAPHNQASSVPMLQHLGSATGNSLTDDGELSGSPDERLLMTSGWSTQIHYLSDVGNAGSTREKPLAVDAPATTQPGPDEEGPAMLRGPNRDELWVTPDTRMAGLAPYVDAWRHKVERVGTLHYPSAGRVAASPLIEVGIAADGSLERAVILRSSGNPELDQAALAILKLASPFPPIPPELAEHVRVLRFKYEWQFTGGRRGTLWSLP